jgi:hypothetical protein
MPKSKFLAKPICYQRPMFECQMHPSLSSNIQNHLLVSKPEFLGVEAALNNHIQVLQRQIRLSKIKTMSRTMKMSDEGENGRSSCIYSKF